MKNKHLRREFAIIFSLVGVCYILFVPLNIKRYTETGEGVIGVGTKNAQYWTLENVMRVSATIDLLVPRESNVITLWPGYLLESKAAILPGMENQFGIQARRRLRSHSDRKYNIISRRELFKSLKGRKASLVLKSTQSLGKSFIKGIKEGNYKRVAVVGGIEFYTLEH